MPQHHLMCVALEEGLKDFSRVKRHEGLANDSLDESKSEGER